MYGYIYETTNLVNGKKYIGKSAHSKFSESYHGSGVYIRKALQKYGDKSFKTVLIEECESLEQLNEREAYWIDYYNAVEDKRYYNAIPGGAGGWYYDRKSHPYSGFTRYSKHSEETKQKMREHHWSKTGSYNQHDRVRSKEEIEKFKSNHWSKLGKTVWNKGIKIPKEKQTDNQKNFGPICKGTVWVNKDGINKRVPKQELEEWLNKGFIKGRLISKEHIEAMKGRTPWNKGLKMTN